MLEIKFIHNVDAAMYEDLIAKVLNKASEMEAVDGTITIVFMNNAEIQTYNAKYRQKNYATDVLSFVDGEFGHLGDLLISLDKCHEQALEYGHSIEREICFLALHGFLHLCGYDHMMPSDEEQMTTRQNEILNTLDIRR